MCYGTMKIMNVSYFSFPFLLQSVTSDIGVAKASGTLCGLPKRWSVVVKVTISFVLIPGLMACIGAIVEAIIYGTTNAPRFHIQLLTYSGLIAAPFILIHWLWKWPKHTYKMGFIFYVVFSVGFFIALSKSTISGSSVFYTGQFIREIFAGKNEADYTSISTKEEAVAWLEKVVNNVYDDSRNLSKNAFSHELPGRVVLVQPMRMRQVRTPPIACWDKLAAAQIVNSERCYHGLSDSSQDRSSYSPLNFSFYNPYYTAYSGRRIFADEIKLPAMIDRYPIAGHWVLWPTQLSAKQARDMFKALKDNNWIDDGTKMIALDVMIVTLDSPRSLLALANFVIEVTDAGKYIPEPPLLSYNYAESVVIQPPRNLTDNDCEGRVSKQAAFLEPVCLGMLPIVIYLIFTHILLLLHDWRAYVQRLYTYTELVFIITVLAAVGLRWASIYVDHCDRFRFNQTLFPTDEVAPGVFYELQVVSIFWFDSRRVLAAALFMHFVNFLKFLNRIAHLGMLTRTLQAALSDLASFSLSFLVVFMAFVSMFYLVFSIESQKYRSFTRCITALWLGMMGEIEVEEELWRIKEWAIPLIILFTFLSTFVLLTVIIAIISDAHERTKDERNKKRREIEESSFFNQSFGEHWNSIKQKGRRSITALRQRSAAHVEQDQVELREAIAFSSSDARKIE